MRNGDLVAQVLELAQLAHGDGVAHVQVGLGRVVAAVDAQRPAFALYASISRPRSSAAIWRLVSSSP